MARALERVEAVMGGEVEVHGADGIVGADELDFLGLGEVAEVEEAELAVADEDADGAGVFSVVHRPLGLGGAEGIGCGGDAGGRRRCVLHRRSGRW